MELKGAVAIVTGGGTGIGRSTAIRLAAAGCRAVVVNYSRSREDAERTAAELSAHGCEGVAYQADVSDDAQARRLAADTSARFGRIDVLINNAGTTRYIDYSDLEAVTPEVWQEIMGTNLYGTFQCSRAVAPQLRRARGTIVNVASIAGHRGAGSSIPYGVSKAGIIQLTRALAVGLAPEVRVNSVSPGQVVTRWARVKKSEEFAAAAEARNAQVTPLKTSADPDHVAQAIMAFVTSDFLTGQDLIVDGGKHITY